MSTLGLALLLAAAVPGSTDDAATASPPPHLPVDATVTAPPTPAATASSAATQPPAAANAGTPSAAPSAATDHDSDSINVVARPPIKADPLENVNVKTFRTIQDVDKAVVGPVAMTYKSKIPNPVRAGLRNALNNLREPTVFVNYLLQLKPGKAAETLGRFTVNSTLGGAGLFDVAKRKPFHLPRRPNGFGYTLGYYGVKSGPYLFLPIIGPTTVRDLAGRIMDISLLPLAVGYPFDSPFYGLSAGVVGSIDDRAEDEDRLRRIREESGDPYGTIRAAYLQQRQDIIDELHGRKKAAPPAPNRVPADLLPVAR